MQDQHGSSASERDGPEGGETLEGAVNNNGQGKGGRRTKGKAQDEEEKNQRYRQYLGEITRSLFADLRTLC